MGGSGECIYQSVEDRKKTLEAVMDEAAGRLTVIAHVACNNTKRTAVFWQPMPSPWVWTGLQPYRPFILSFRNIRLPGTGMTYQPLRRIRIFIIYNIPQLAGTALTMSLWGTMLLNGRVAGVKNSSMPVQDIQMFKAEAMKTREDFIVFNGPDEQLVSGLAMGADGGIGGTYGAMPELFLKIYDLVSENRMAEARAIQYDADEIIYKLCSGTCNMYAMIKEVLRVSRELI